MAARRPTSWPRSRVARRPPATSPRSPRRSPMPTAWAMPGSWCRRAGLRRRARRRGLGLVHAAGAGSARRGRPRVPRSSWMCPSAVRRCGSCTAPGPDRSRRPAPLCGRGDLRHAPAHPPRWPRTPRSGCSSSATTRAPCRALPPRRPRRTPAASSPGRPTAAVAWPAATSPSASWRPAAPRSRSATPWPIASRQGRGAGSGSTPSPAPTMRSRWRPTKGGRTS